MSFGRFFYRLFGFGKTEPVVNRIVEIKWQKGETVRDTVDRPVPVETIIVTAYQFLFLRIQQHYLPFGKIII